MTFAYCINYRVVHIVALNALRTCLNENASETFKHEHLGAERPFINTFMTIYWWRYGLPPPSPPLPLPKQKCRSFMTLLSMKTFYQEPVRFDTSAPRGQGILGISIPPRSDFVVNEWCLRASMCWTDVEWWILGDQSSCETFASKSPSTNWFFWLWKLILNCIDLNIFHACFLMTSKTLKPLND